ncbi:MAG TPA: tetratricopeptide repeat protein, partial [Pyrinomonadaceae bacterium]
MRIAGERVISLAVLPFTSLTSTNDDAPLAIGLADALITRLSNLPQIVVRPTASILRYAQDHRDPISIAMELGVEFVISGSIQQVADRLRLTVQMVTPDQKRCVWADAFEERLTHIFSVEDSISSRVASALTLKLTNAQRESFARKSTANSEAYQTYLHGRYFWSNQTFASALQAIEYFRRAIALDPKYALAWAGIADAYILIGLSGALTGGLPTNQIYPDAKKAALKSIELYEAQAEAHAALGFIRFFYDWDEQDALAEFERALSLQPYYASAHHGLALVCGFLGRCEESLASIETALEIEPLSPILNANKGYLLYTARRYSESVVQLQKALELDPNFSATHYRLALALCAQREYDEAIRQLNEAQRLSDGSPHVVGTLGYVNGLVGRKDSARESLHDLTTASRTRHVSPTIPAEVQIGLGDHDEALSWLQRAFDERAPSLITFRVDPRFDQIRSIPKFAKLLESLFLTPRL